MTPADMLARELRRDAARPLLTWYDDARPARVELSVATAANWAAKLANLLVDDLDVEAGSPVGLRLPAHWQTAVILLGVWSAGGCAVVGGGGEPAFGAAGSGLSVELALDPMGVGLSQVCGGQPDVFVPAAPPAAETAALELAGRTWSHAELAAAALHGAQQHGLDASSRVLSVLDYDTVDGLDAGLLVPLAAGGSVVLVTAADPAALGERCRVERVTHTAGFEVDGLPALA